MDAIGRINPNDYYVVLGKIVVSMNRLELDIRHTFTKMLGQETGTFLMAFSATENFSRLFEIFRFVFRYKITDEDLCKKFDTLCNKIANLSKERSRYVHSNWFFTMDNLKVIRYKARKWPIDSEQDSQPDLQILKNLVSDLAASRTDLLNFVDQVFSTTSA
jgi:hypothetical protein